MIYSILMKCIKKLVIILTNNRDYAIIIFYFYIKYAHEREGKG